MSKPTRNPMGGSRPDGQKTTSRPAVAGGQVVGAGLTLAVTVGLFAYFGLWLDKQFGTRPWMLLLLVLVGILGGMLHLIRVVAPDMLPFDKPAKNDGEQDDGPPSPG